jgi:hypothetical protein
VELSRRGFAEALTVPLVAEEPNTDSVKTGLVFEKMCDVFERLVTWHLPARIKTSHTGFIKQQSDISLSLRISQPEVETFHTSFIKHQSTR